MVERYEYFNRDLSWLSFNYRVLEEAKDKSLPLFERIKFLAIYSNNLNEFYKVRVASYKHMQLFSVKSKKKFNLNPTKILQQINNIVDNQQYEFGLIFKNDILPELFKNNLILLQEEKINDTFRSIIRNFFQDEVRPYVQPLILTPGILPFLNDNTIYFIVRLFKKNQKTGEIIKEKKPQYAITKIPAHKLPRFINLATIDSQHYIIFLDDIVKQNLDLLYPGFVVDAAYSITLSRDADLYIEDEFSGDLIQKLQKSLIKRKTGSPTRFLYDSSMNDDFKDVLKKFFSIKDGDFIAGGAYHNFFDFFQFPNPYSPKLENDYLPQLPHKRIDKYKSIFVSLNKKEWMLHFPYQSYDYVIQFLYEAAEDPEIIEIKTTQYRVASDSKIVEALIKAARNGKKVTVFVELKARFDEESNLFFAEEMKKAGIHIIYSIPGLKVHCKVALALRNEVQGQSRTGYAFLSTGNFNEKTAKLYGDHGLFSSENELIEELDKVFHFLENQNNRYDFKHLLVAQVNMQQCFIQYIDNEIQAAQNGKKAYMILKMNGLEDKKMIDKLYEASEAGVKIDLIVRGVCCLVPNKPFSKNITVTRIVDRFLEHARVFAFYNNGKYILYLGSADWMNRNLYRRIEVAFPIYNTAIKKEVIDILKIQLKDNVKARILDEEMNNIPKTIGGNELIRSQIETYNYLQEIHGA